MKKILLLTCLLGFTGLSLAAQERTLPEVYESAEELTERYQLTEEQQAALAPILATRQSNFEEIEYLRQTNSPTYWLKRKAIYLGEQGSIRMILNTPAQINSYGALARKLRVEESKMIQEYLAQGKEKPAARLLLLQNKY